MMTSKSLTRMKVPHNICVEPQEMDNYRKAIKDFGLESCATLLELPFSNHGKGSGPARNWIWEHAEKIVGSKRHWIHDDNISDYYRLHENQRYRVESGAVFAAAEDFVDRYTNVPLAGFQYRFFVAPGSKQPPYVLNTRVFSCMLIENSCPHRWRGKYNEDVDLSYRILEAGYCTILFYAFMCGKAATLSVKGGNTEELYGSGSKKMDKSQMLVDLHPDDAEIVWRYGRWHHKLSFERFKENKLILRPDVDLEELRRQGPNEYGMKLVKNWTGEK